MQQINLLRKQQKAEWYRKNKEVISAKRKAKYKYIDSSQFNNRKFDRLIKENSNIEKTILELQELIAGNHKQIHEIAKIEWARNNPKFENFFSNTRL